MTAPPVVLDERPDAVVVHVHAGLDATVAATLRGTLSDAVDRHPAVIVDLSEVPTLDSTGLGLLVRAHRQARRRDGVVVLAGPSRFVITVLHTMHVDGLFPILDDCDSALAWLRELGMPRPRALPDPGAQVRRGHATASSGPTFGHGHGGRPPTT